jgi:hypothetical protein
MLPPSEDARWFQMMPIDLLNAPQPEDSDEIGVPVRWVYPAVGDVKLKPDNETLILTELNKQQYWRESSQAKDWVGIAIGQALGLDVTTSGQAHKQVLGIIKDLIARKLLIECEVKIRGKKTPCVTIDPKLNF